MTFNNYQPNENLKMIGPNIDCAWFPHTFVSSVIFKTFSKECLFILNIISKGYALDALEHCQLEKGTKIKHTDWTKTIQIIYTLWQI